MLKYLPLAIIIDLDDTLFDSRAMKKYYPKNKNLPETTRMELPINHYITGNKSKFKIVKTF